MEEKLIKLYAQCVNELKSIGIDLGNKEIVGDIDIRLSPRASKRYGCCKQEEPDRAYKNIEKYGRKGRIYGISAYTIREENSCNSGRAGRKRNCPGSKTMQSQKNKRFCTGKRTLDPDKAGGDCCRSKGIFCKKTDRGRTSEPSSEGRLPVGRTDSPVCGANAGFLWKDYHKGSENKMGQLQRCRKSEF